MDAADKIITHATVRFYSDESHKVSVVPIEDIVSFDKNLSVNEPYYIKRYKNGHQFSHLSPGEVVLAGGKDDLINNATRHKFKRIYRSDAIELLEKKTQKVNPKKKNSNKSNRAQLKRLAKVKAGERELQKFITRRKPFIDDNEEDLEHESLSAQQHPILECEEESLSPELYKKHDELELSGKNQPLLTAEVLRPFDNEEISVTENQKSSIEDETQSLSAQQLLNLDVPEKSLFMANEEKHDEVEPYKENQFLLTEEVGLHLDHEEIPDAGNRQSQGTSMNNLSNIIPSNCPSPIVNNSNNNREIGYTETPRSTRRRQTANLTTYRKKINITDINEVSVYDNSLQAESRDIDGEGKELYATEGDEIYVGCNKMIQLAFWEYMKHRGPWVFLRELLEIYWGKHELVNRCFKVLKIQTTIENRSPKKVLSPSKYKTLRLVFKDYLNESMGDSSKKKRILKNMNRHIGYKIRDLRKSLYEKVL